MSTSEVNLNAYEGFDCQFKFDGSDRTGKYIVINQHGTHIQVSPSAYLLLSAVRSGISFEQLAKQLNVKSNGRRPVTTALLQSSYARLLQQLGAIESSSLQRRLPWGFWLRLPLLSRQVVGSIVRWFTFLYSPSLANFALPVIALVPCYYAFFHFTPSASDHAFVYGYLLFLFSLLVHEFGHATACARYGAQPDDIGFAMYLIYPALYSDVTRAWRLTRMQRVIVDLGGCYFQLLLGACFLLLFKFTGWAPLRVSVLLIVYTCLFSLNPIFKFDGYWVLADALGIPNLGRQVSRIRSQFWRLLCGRKMEPLPWPKKILFLLLLYSIASTSVWVLFIYRLIPVFIHACQTLSTELALIARELYSGARPSLLELKSMLGSVYFLVVIAIMITQVLKRLLKQATRKSAPQAAPAVVSRRDIVEYDV